MLLAINDLHVRYGNVEVLHGISLHVAEGEIVTILGANGAGKSTTLLCISGLVRPSAGEILFDGLALHKLPAHQVVQARISQSPEGRRVFGTLTVEENINLGAFTIRDKAKIARTREWIYDLFPRLAERRTQLAGTLSGGEQQMVAMGRALISRPKVLLLDEPSMSLSPIMVDKIFEVVRDVSAQGVTVLLVEQNASRALAIADRGYVMDSGLITMTGDGKTMLKDPKVRAAYLGE